jgi:translation elongation factor EF-1alpha
MKWISGNPFLAMLESMNTKAKYSEDIPLKMPIFDCFNTLFDKETIVTGKIETNKLV